MGVFLWLMLTVLQLTEEETRRSPNRSSKKNNLQVSSGVEPGPADLSASEVSDVVNRSQQIISRLGINETSAFNLDNQTMSCALQWVFTDEEGRARIVETEGHGRSKKAALARARMTLLSKIGVEESVSNVERVGARRIRELILNQNLAAAVKEAVSSIHASTPEAWSGFLLQLWKAALASYQLIHIENIVRALDHVGNDGMEVLVSLAIFVLSFQ